MDPSAGISACNETRYLFGAISAIFGKFLEISVSFGKQRFAKFNIIELFFQLKEISVQALAGKD